MLAWLGGVLVITVLLALWIPLSKIGASSETIRTWIEPLGPLAPLAFFVLNIIQILVAPIPGYPVQILGGVLFGLILGSIITVSGMVAGGTLAAWLARRLGRPWLEQRVGAEELEHWSQVAHVNSFWMWWLILLIPLFGDVPYFIAGLTKIRLSAFALAILISRGPFTVFIVWTGHSAIDLPLKWLVAVIGVVVIFVLIAFSQAKRIQAWGRVYLSRFSNRHQVD
ncbi:MAG: TVP38/TMEM64 family protein [Anaerolineae bacterium]|nr:TVP38/TMEM64 family protein [Anaerolineae bacterium]